MFSSEENGVFSQGKHFRTVTTYARYFVIFRIYLPPATHLPPPRNAFIQGTFDALVAEWQMKCENARARETLFPLFLHDFTFPCLNLEVSDLLFTFVVRNTKAEKQ